MPTARGSKQTERGYNWIDFADFTPGIHNNTYSTNSQSSHLIIPAPQGSASLTTTYGCMAYPTGGLGPLPKITNFANIITTTSVTATVYLTGIVNYQTTTGTNLVYMLQKVASGTGNVNFKAYALIHTGAATHVIASPGTKPFTSKIGVWGSPYPVFTRMSHTPTSPTHIPYPVIVFPAMIDDTNITSGHLYVWPGPTTRTTYTAIDLNTSGLHKTGQVIAHQGRVVVLNNSVLTWPSGHHAFTNDLISFTTPSASETLLQQSEAFSPEQPFGYGGGGSISAGELFLIKKQGGAVVVSGTIASPQVIFLGGVQPTGNFYGQVGQTVAGLMYCSSEQGAWLWNGGNISQKISPQLQDSFFSTPTTMEIPHTTNYGYYVQPWGEWVLFSNSWVFNTRTNSWWRLTSNNINSQSFFYYTPGRSSGKMFAAKKKHTSGTANFKDVVVMTKSLTGASWQWRSIPTKLTENRYLNVREIAIYASATSLPGGKISVTVYGETTPVSIFTVAVNTTEPHLFRIPCGVTVVDRLEFKLQGTNTTTPTTTPTANFSAPILHQISFGYTERQHVKTTAA